METILNLENLPKIGYGKFLDKLESDLWLIGNEEKQSFQIEVTFMDGSVKSFTPIFNKESNSYITEFPDYFGYSHPIYMFNTKEGEDFIIDFKEIRRIKIF